MFSFISEDSSALDKSASSISSIDDLFGDNADNGSSSDGNKEESSLFDSLAMHRENGESPKSVGSAESTVMEKTISQLKMENEMNKYSNKKVADITKIKDPFARVTHAATDPFANIDEELQAAKEAKQKKANDVFSRIVNLDTKSKLTNDYGRGDMKLKQTLKSLAGSDKNGIFGEIKDPFASSTTSLMDTIFGDDLLTPKQEATPKQVDIFDGLDVFKK